MDEYVFTTEGHLLPLFLSDTNNTYKTKPGRKVSYFSMHADFSCPSDREAIKSLKSHKNMEKSNYYKLLRRNVKDFTSRSSTTSFRKSTITPRLRASEFSAMKPDHVELVKQLGINVIVLRDGRVQLVHNSAAAHSQEHAEEGASFMQEMILLSKQQVEEEQRLRTISFSLPSSLRSNQVNITLLGGPAQFGLDLASLEEALEGVIVRAEPIDACSLQAIRNKTFLRGKIVLTQRGNCMFIEKARNAQKLGAIGVVVVDNVENSSSKTMPMFAMSGDGSSDVTIPAVFLYSQDAKILSNAMDEHGPITVRMDAHHDEMDSTLFSKDIAAQLFEGKESDNKAEKVASSSEPKDSLLDMGGIFNVLKSNKLKFDLLSSLNLKEIKDENINLIMSIISKLASSRDLEKDELTEITSRGSTNPFGSLHTRSTCLNPYQQPSAFRAYLSSVFSHCWA